MCFGSGEGAGHRPRSDRKNIKPMHQLGYHIGEPRYGDHPFNRNPIAIYPVRDVNSIIALLAESVDDGLL